MFKINSDTNQCRFIKADDGKLGFLGRIDFSNPGSPVIIWQGTRIKANFTGNKVGIKFRDNWGQNFFNVIIDGKIHLLKAEPVENDYMLDETLADGPHELIIFKRTEAIFGHITFKGIFIDKSGSFGPVPAIKKRIEFYGDSITAGACNENPGDDNYDDYSTHNNYMAYGAITSRALDLDYSCISVSGTGLCYSWNPVLMLDIYDKIYPDRESPVYGFSGCSPDIVVINLGQNDFGYPKSIGKIFPADFCDKYMLLVRNIRNLYAKAFVVCTIGGMSAWRESPDLQKAFKEAVGELGSKDDRIRSYEFDAFSYNHPRTDVHVRMADELTSFLKGEFPEFFHEHVKK
jgi:hypothetical protein